MSIMKKNKLKSIWAIIIYAGIICTLVSIGTWTGEFLGTPSVDDNYYHQEESTCVIDNVSYSYNIWFGLVTKSMDGFFVLSDIELYITEGHIEFTGIATPKDKNISIVIMFSPPIRQNGLFYDQSEPMKTTYDGNKTYAFIPMNMIFDYPVSEQKHLRPIVMENGTVIDGSLNDFTFVEVQPAYMRTQLNLTKATIILSYWVVFLSIITTLFEYKRTKKDKTRSNNEELINGEKEMWERLNKVNSRTWNRIFSSSVVIGILILFYGAIASFYHLWAETSILVTVGLGLISIGIAFISLNLANESDKKMIDIAKSDFSETLSVFEDERIRLIEELKNIFNRLTQANNNLNKATTKKARGIIQKEIDNTVSEAVGRLEVATWKSLTHLKKVKILQKYVEKTDRDTLVYYFQILVQILPWGSNLILNREIKKIITMYILIWKDFEVSDAGKKSKERLLTLFENNIGTRKTDEKDDIIFFERIQTELSNIDRRIPFKKL